MNKSWTKLAQRYKYFTKYDWATMSIGITLLLCYLVVTITEWIYVSNRTVEVYRQIAKPIEIISQNNTNATITNLVYPNATYLFWGGSTYWFTFMTNVFMGATLTFYPTAKNSQRAQKFYFAAMVYIIIVVSAYWSGIALVPSTFTDSFPDQKAKSIVMHVIAPVLGLSTLFWEKKRISIANSSIWSLIIYPGAYFLFLIIPTYVIGYKFLQFGVIKDAEGNILKYPTELARGIVIYQLVSFNYPLGYQGDVIYLKVSLNILMVLLAFLSAPIVGFLVRKILRIPKPGEVQPKLYFIAPEARHAKHFALLKERYEKKTLWDLAHEHKQETLNKTFQKKMLEAEADLKKKKNNSKKT